jgi:hypothetical protein
VSQHTRSLINPPFEEEASTSVVAALRRRSGCPTMQRVNRAVEDILNVHSTEQIWIVFERLKATPEPAIISLICERLDLPFDPTEVDEACNEIRRLMCRNLSY